MAVLHIAILRVNKIAELNILTAAQLATFLA
jgi:hypothetical protein